MKLKLSEWANIAEVLGACAIVVSLIFVGVQISDGNRETRAATVQSALDAEMAFQAEILRYADTWLKVVSGQPFSDDVEERRGIILYNMMMTQNENSYVQMKVGFLEASTETLAEGVSWPIYEIWTRSGGYRGRSLEFREFLDAERKRLAAE
jgi:hypothetical protein